MMHNMGRIVGIVVPIWLGPLAMRTPTVMNHGDHVWRAALGEACVCFLDRDVLVHAVALAA